MNKHAYDERMLVERNSAGHLAFQMTYITAIIGVAVGVFWLNMDPVIVAYGLLPAFIGGFVYVSLLYRKDVHQTVVEQLANKPSFRARKIIAVIFFFSGQFCFFYFWQEDPFGIALIGSTVVTAVWAAFMWWFYRRKQRPVLKQDDEQTVSHP